ncbi:serum amyloid A protein-like [Mya arenaria]|uniref:serum amyloid A protein-like n=1 Tax=Mya arenaria TaxID=6604 RepID=UPI0022E7198B|nr:serum amyloid A protein-like [Mya arenaria]XP_052776312.1 serum amyloid A protein-like [Mya arenaria]
MSRLAIAVLCFACIVSLSEHVSAQNVFRRGYNYARDFAGGARDMWRSYSDMRRANTIGADKYFHARGNYEAARRGTGGRHAATLISNAREYWQGGSGRGAEDSAADQEANRWGRHGGNPNRYRPKGLDERY